MEFEQKAEEKKMSMSKNIARLAVTAGLTAALSFGGVMAPVTMAFAEGGAGSTVTFVDTDYATSSTYKGIQIFKATVTKTGENTTVSGIEWAGADTNAQQAIRDAVVGAIKTKNKKYESTNAQDAAEWLNANAGVNETDSRIENNNVLNIIAKNLSAEGFTWKTTEQGNNTFDGLDAGYWLFLTASVKKPDEGSAVSQSTDAFTSPIFELVDGTNPVKIAPKKRVPTVEKKIVSDKDGAEYDVSDSHIGQDVTYNLYGTIADNYATYGEYYYQFSDQISKGLTLQKNSAKVYLYASPTAAKNDPNHESNTATDISNAFDEVSSDADSSDGSVKTTWTCNNLKTIPGVTITKDSCIVVSYTARINSTAVVGKSNNGLGNYNTVTLYYSNNPMTTDRGQTVPDTVRDYTYGLKINKVDLGTERPLDGAMFTIQAIEADDTVLEKSYVQKNGSLGKDPWEFTTTNGVIQVTGLDAGKYIVKETSAPDNYIAVADFTFEIKPKMENAVLTGLTHDLDTNNQAGKVIAGLTDGNAGDNTLTAMDGSEIDDEGYYNITVGDTKKVGLPLTGLNGVTFTWIAGGAVLCIGVAHLIRSRKQAEESEQE